MSLIIGIFVWCRIRRRRLRLPVNQLEEENIPLNTSHRYDEEEEGPDQPVSNQRKGKARAVEPAQPPIFDVGDSDDEDDRPHKKTTLDV
jgi:carboxypeptidase D